MLALSAAEAQMVGLHLERGVSAMSLFRAAKTVANRRPVVMAGCRVQHACATSINASTKRLSGRHTIRLEIPQLNRLKHLQWALQSQLEHRNNGIL